MVPCKSLLEIFTLLRNVRLPIEGGMVPDKPWPPNFKMVTLCCWRLQVTPCHWQNSMESFHKPSTALVLSPPAKWVFKSSNESLSLSVPNAVVMMDDPKFTKITQKKQ
ncbi:hypothetical protein TorRG33x02_091010 [Trema orientale]|uniref:Uncharacterized protein n=1 Tax=Trema orientale TaxID=63057 RepID=A0A2P5FBN4_TREOI|nr:hypothetical protein TorRG33x02_091010 [Trema orientale]